MVMENPWEDKNIVHDNGIYYAKVDKDAILALRDRLKSNKAYELHLECKAPSACTGDINAPVYLLSTNPGYRDEQAPNRKPKYNPDYPFGPMDLSLENTGAGIFVRQKMRWRWEELAKKAGIDEGAARKIVAKNICEVMYFGYKSRKYNSKAKYILPSQDYSVELVQKAIKDKKLIIIMSSRKLWMGKVEALQEHETKNHLVYDLKCPMGKYISPGNIHTPGYNKLPDPGFGKLIERLLTNKS
jgi:hypothetical protein